MGPDGIVRDIYTQVFDVGSKVTEQHCFLGLAGVQVHIEGESTLRLLMRAFVRLKNLTGRSHRILSGHMDRGNEASMRVSDYDVQPVLPCLDDMPRKVPGAFSRDS